MNHVQLFEEFHGGKLITAYHRTGSLENVQAIMAKGFDMTKSRGGRAVYGSGTYFFVRYDFAKQPSHARVYGEYVIKAKIDMGNLLVLDRLIYEDYHLPDLETQLLHRLGSYRAKYRPVQQEDSYDDELTIQGRKFVSDVDLVKGRIAKVFKSDDGRSMRDPLEPYDKVRARFPEVFDWYDTVTNDEYWSIGKEEIMQLHEAFHPYGGLGKFFDGIITSDHNSRFDMANGGFTSNPIGFMAIMFNNNSIKPMKYFACDGGTEEDAGL